jgi:drug/metabolite transporter (DMT)-like permease
MTPPPPAPDRPFAATIWMLGSVVAFTAMAIAGREAAAFHDTFEIMLWRSAIGFLIVITVAGLAGRLAEVRRDRLGQHLVRNIFHFTGQNLWLWSLGLIPLAQVFALEFTSPLWVILLSPLLLGDRLTAPKLTAAGLGFAGIWIVAHPDFSNPDPGVLAAAGSAVCFAATLLMTKMLTRGESIVSILFWLTLMQTGFGFATAMADGRMIWPTAESAPLLGLIGICGLTAHLCLTTALSLARASVVVPVDFLRLPLITVVGVLFYDEPLALSVMIGGALILGANWINLRFGAMQRPAKA